MRHIDYGLGIFRRESFADAPAGHKFDLAGHFQNLLAEGQLAGYEVTDDGMKLVPSPDWTSSAGCWNSDRPGRKMTFTEQFLAWIRDRR